MADLSSFWRRVGDVLRGGFSHRNGNGRAGDSAVSTATWIPSEAELHANPPSSANAVAEPPDSRGRSSGRSPAPGAGGRSLLPWNNRSADLGQLREGYDRVVRMMDALQDHFEKQDERARHLVCSMERVAGTLEQMTAAQSAQGESIHMISANVESSGRHAAALSESLSRLPASMNAQADALRTMTRRIEAAQETDLQLTNSLDRFGGAIEVLGTTNRAQTETLQRIHQAGLEERESLAAMIRDQGRRFAILLGITMFVALACAGSILYLILQLRAGG